PLISAYVTAPSTLSLHDALPIWASSESTCSSSGGIPCNRSQPNSCSDRLTNWSFRETMQQGRAPIYPRDSRGGARPCYIASRKEDRKSTRLNSSHDQISYAVFCL